MKTFAGAASVGGELKGASLALGNFDGCHLGHQALFATAKVHAHKRGARAAALTFEPHPTRVLAPAVAPRRIGNAAQKLGWMAQLGLDAVVVEPFDVAFAATEAEGFTSLLLDQMGVDEIVVGFDFTYGKGRKGNLETLEAACKQRGKLLSVVPRVTVDGLPASSSKVRELVLEGRVAAAARLLDRHHVLIGEVVHGDGRGRTIGFPTANLAPDTELIPASGVYAARVEAGGGSWAAAVNIGRKPTVSQGDATTIELHLLDFTGDLYGKPLEAAFLERLRGEQRFPSLDALKAQIAADVATCRRLAAELPRLPMDRPGSNVP